MYRLCLLCPVNHPYWGMVGLIWPSPIVNFWAMHPHLPMVDAYVAYPWGPRRAAATPCYATGGGSTCLNCLCQKTVH